jgi:TolB protein
LIQCGGPKQLTQDEYDQLSPQERVTYLEKYVKSNSTDISAQKQLYREYLDLGMVDNALTVMENIIRQDPYQPDVQFDYGELLIKRGETVPAYRAFRDALNSPGGSQYSTRVSRYLGGKYAVQQVTSTAADEAFPVFSADGRKIIYQTNEGGNWDIAEKDILSGETRMLVSTGASEELPFLSPNGKKILYTSNADDRRPIDEKFKVREIYIMDLETKITKNLTESIADDWLPRFNRDGSKISFVSERSDLRSVPYTEKHSDIYLMESDGDFHLQLTDDDANDGGATFDASDKHIYFHSNKNGSYDIFVMKADGSLPMILIENPGSNEVNPFVSADSQYITFFSDQTGSYEIYRAKIDGSEVERITMNPFKNTNPAFSPDGQSIVYHSDQNGNYDIFIINLQSTSEPTTQELIRQLDALVGGS